MPIVNIRLPRNIAPEDTLERVRIATKGHVLASLSADQSHHDYVTISEDIAKIGDGVPLVEVDQRVGREKWRKEKFAKLVQKTIKDELGIEETKTFVVFRETTTDHCFYVGDGFLEPFDPAAHADQAAVGS